MTDRIFPTQVKVFEYLYRRRRRTKFKTVLRR